MYLNFIYIIPLYMFRTPMCPSSGASQAITTTYGTMNLKPYHLHVLTVLKSVSFKLLEPSGPVQACNGIGLLARTEPANINLSTETLLMFVTRAKFHGR